ncbi:MAG: LicD family protein [Clostridia bacterium]|nr:LicD family protein [Clostridia bacterium]
MPEKRDIQLVQLEILKEVAKVCDENGIDYMLSDGALIGAVRHKGFIPWDDDIDICMTAENYIKFCKIGQKHLGDRFFVQNWKSEKEFSELWTQVRMNDTTSMPIKFKKWNINFGIHIDVFPVVGVRDGEKKISKQQRRYNYCRAFLLKDHMKATDETAVGFQKIINRIPRFIRRGIASVLYRKLMISPKKTRVAAEMWTGIDPKYRSEIFYDFTYLDFENCKIKTMKDYDEFLTILYGDYMTPPPESERKGHMGGVLETIKDTTKSYKFYQ